MRIPVWLTLGVAAVVIIFGLYRIRLGLKQKTDEAQTEATRKGFYPMSKRAHLFIGIIYLVLGGGLIATSFGWNPFGDSSGPEPAKPTKQTAPTKSTAPTAPTESPAPTDQPPTK